MTITVNTEQELVELSKELIHTLVNYIFWDKAYQQEPSREVLKRKEYWQVKADDIFKEYGISKTDQLPKLFIKHIPANHDL